jgi:phosphopantothenoylcysteine decarboxylase / phosphopantothenate---cysteine ligase
VEPEAGPLASGQSSVGRLAEIDSIVDAVVAAVGDRPVRAPDAGARPPIVETPTRDADLEGRHVVVTAGGTREPIDPVRFIGNRSTGRMGVALAEAALQRGARVTLIAANVEVALPAEAHVAAVESTAELEAALDRVVRATDGGPGFDVLVMAAAVSDFRPAAAADAKLARADGLALRLESTPDLIAGVARAVADGGVRRPVLVGFAAETGSLDRAAEKLARKGVDLLVANDVSEPGSGFGTDTNRVAILAADGSRDDLPLQSKRAVADALFDRVVGLLDARDRAAQTDATNEPAREPA